MPTVDTIHEYILPSHTHVSRCRLRIYAHNAGYVVVLTELAENQGMSVTNAADTLATETCLSYSLNPATTTWLEHYTPDSYKERTRSSETFDQITFTWNGNVARHPQWRHVTLEEVETLTGVTWATGNLTDDTNRIAESFGLEWVQADWAEVSSQ